MHERKYGDVKQPLAASINRVVLQIEGLKMFFILFFFGYHPIYAYGGS